MLFVDSLFIRDDDRISNFCGFAEKLSSNEVFWKRNWNVFEQKDGVCLYKLKSDKNFINVTMSLKIVISDELLVSIYQNEIESDIRELNWILKNSRLEHWSQFYKIAEYYQNEPTVQTSTHAFIKQALNCLNKVEFSDPLNGSVEPIKQQLNSVISEIEMENKRETEDNLFESKVFSEPKYQVESEDDRDVIPFGLFFDKETNFETPPSHSKSSQPSEDQAIAKAPNSKATTKCETSSDIYKCQHCDKFFLSMRKLRSHLQSHVRTK